MFWLQQQVRVIATIESTKQQAQVPDALLLNSHSRAILRALNQLEA